MIWIDAAFLAVLLVVFPVVSAHKFPRELRAIAEGRAGARVSGYRGTMAWQWSLLASGLAVWFLGGRSLGEIGFRAPQGWGFWVSATLAFVGTAALTGQLRAAERDETARGEIRTQLGGTLAFLPRHAGELRGFTQLSVTAGICEEVLYRGWFLGFFAPLLGMPAAFVASVLVFGLAHSYGGRDVVRKAGAMGLILGALYLLSGSLWVPIALHVFVDINAGMLSAAAFRDVSRAEAAG